MPRKCLRFECAEYTSNPKYCSRSCAATVNNSASPKKRATHRLCSGCNAPTKNRATYFCGDACRQLLDDSRIEERDYGRVRNTPENDATIYSIWESGDLRGLTRSDGTLSAYARNLLLRVRGAKCIVCGWGEINPTSGRVAVTVDHADGDAHNNLSENLRVLCPNHHSLTPTYGALNMRGVRERNGFEPLSRDFARFGRQRLVV